MKRLFNSAIVGLAFVLSSTQGYPQQFDGEDLHVAINLSAASQGIHEPVDYTDVFDFKKLGNAIAEKMGPLDGVKFRQVKPVMGGIMVTVNIEDGKKANFDPDMVLEVLGMSDPSLKEEKKEEVLEE